MIKSGNFAMRTIAHRSRLAATAVLAALTLLAAGCARSPAYKALAEQPADYDKRHPILLTRATQSAAIPVGAYDYTVTGLQRSAIEAFAQSFRSDGEGSLAISVPTGAANHLSAARMASDVRAIFQQAGVPADAIVTRNYQPDAVVLAPPILLSYTRLTAAVPHPCALSGDVDTTILNSQWENFGCAAQTNLAAIIANPNDLSRPRPLDKPSAARRATVLEKYRTGEDPKTKYQNPNSGSASTVGQGG